MEVTAVFIHGMWGTSKGLGPLAERISKVTEVKSIDLDRSNPEKLRFQDFINQVERFINNISGKVILIGHSMGGLLAQTVGTPRKGSHVSEDKIAGRILLAPAAPRGILQVRNWEQIRSIITQLPQRFKPTNKPSPEVAERLIFNQHKALGIEWDPNSFQDLPTLVFHDVFCGVYAPRREKTEILVGEDDLITPPSIQNKTAAYHKTTLRKFPGHDHMSILKDNTVGAHVELLVRTFMNGKPSQSEAV